MKFEKIERKSHFYNEDRCIIGNDFFMVVDGATPLIKNGVKPSEASWFAGYIKKHLKNKNSPIIPELLKISKLAYDDFVKLSYNNEKYFPSAGLAWIEVKENLIDIYTIGDCEVVIKYKDNSLKRVIIDKLPRLDNEALEQLIIEANKRNLSILEARPFIDDLLIKNRSLMNKPNGYPVFTIASEPNFEFLHIIEDKEEISNIYIYTDGITQAFDELKIYNDWNEMFRDDFDINELVKSIVERSNNDPKCNKYPRFKKIDDITLIKLTF